MSGRPKSKMKPIYRSLSVETDECDYVINDKFRIRCPECGSEMISTSGTQLRGNTRVEGFICNNKGCYALKTRKKGRQFTLTSSLNFELMINEMLGKIIHKIAFGTSKKSQIAYDYGLSPALITYIHAKLVSVIERDYSLDDLMLTPSCDIAIAVDETFLKINGKSCYILIASGYQSRKVLGLRVSFTRKEHDLRFLFDEAERNTLNPIKIVTADAWGATQSMVKNLNRDIMLMIHKHKKPYERAVIRNFQYTPTHRIITDIGVRTDFFKKKGKREYFFIEKIELLNPPKKKKRGRPKGVKNGQGIKHPKKRKKKKRGRKNLFTVFTAGQKGYANIDPYRKKIKLGKGVSQAVSAALRETIHLYSRIFIQNNLAENINSVLCARLILSGPKTLESVERKLRVFFFLRNHPEILQEIDVKHRFSNRILKNQIKRCEVLHLLN